MAGRFTIELLGDKALSAALASLTERLERKVLTQAFRKASQTVLADAQARVGVGVNTPVLTLRQGRRARRKGVLVRGIRNSLAIRPLKRQRNRVGYTVVTGTRAQLGIDGKYYYPAHVEAGHGPPGEAVARAIAHASARASRRAIRHEFGGRRTPPHPYLRPALKSNEGRLLSQLGHDIGAGIEKVAQEK